MSAINAVHALVSVKWRRVLLIACEAYLGYYFWSMWQYWIFQEYMFALLVTGLSATMVGFLAFLVFPPFFLAIPPVLRAAAVIPFLVDPTPYHLARVVLSSIGLMLAVWSLACAPDLHPRRQRRLFYGLVLGLLLMMCIRLGWYSLNPVTMMPLNIPGAVLAIAAAVFIMVLDYRREQLDATLPPPASALSPPLVTVDSVSPMKPAAASAGVAGPAGAGSGSASVAPAPPEVELSVLGMEQEKAARPPAIETRPGHTHRSEALGWGEWLVWVPDAFALGSLIYLSLFFCTASALLPRYAGYEVFPLEIVTIFTLALGIVAAPALRAAGVWWALAILGAGLIGYIADAGAFIGGLLIVFSVPCAWWAMSQELVWMRGKVTGATVLGMLVVLFWMFADFGTVAGSNVPGIGRLFLRYMPGAMWPMVLLLGIALFLLNLRYVAAAAHRSYKDFFRRLLLPKPRMQPAAVTVVMLLIGVIFIASVIVRGANRNFRPAPPVAADAANNLTAMTYNVFQGATVLGHVNFYALADVLRSTRPLVMGLQESSPAHVVTANRDLIGYLEGFMGYDALYGLPERFRSVGVSIVTAAPHVRPLTDGNCTMMAATTAASLTRTLCERDVLYNNTVIRLFSAHLELGEFAPLDAQLQAEQIAARMNATTTPLLLMADLNNPYNSTVVRTLLATGARSALDDLVNTTVPTHYSGEHIDYVFYRGLRATSARVVTESFPTSDHYPVLATFSTL